MNPETLKLICFSIILCAGPLWSTTINDGRPWFISVVIFATFPWLPNALDLFLPGIVFGIAGTILFLAFVLNLFFKGENSSIDKD